MLSQILEQAYMIFYSMYPIFFIGYFSSKMKKWPG